MPPEMDAPWSQLAALLLLALGLMASLLAVAVKVLLQQFELRLAARFAAQEEARQQATSHWEANFDKVLARQDKDTEAVQRLEKELLTFKADLPVHYVRREDYVRGQSLVESKLDGLALLIQNIALKGGKHVD